MVSPSKHNPTQGNEPTTDKGTKGSVLPKVQDVLQLGKQPSEDSRRFQALLSTKETVENKNRQQLNARPNRDKSHHSKHGEHKIGGETVAHEQSDRIAFRLLGGSPQTQQQKNMAARVGAKPGTIQGLPHNAEEQIRTGTPTAKEPVSAPLTGMASSDMSESAKQRFAEKQQSSGVASQQSGLNAGNSEQPGVKQEPKLEVIKLLDLVGPEATLTLKERLKEVWVNLDNTASSELDVLARMPANEVGLSNTELLTVQSPQGIHFVAFLKNRNDFEVLQTFDRNALLPGNPTKQLMEAAVVAYEQLGMLFKDGATKLESRVKALPTKSGREQEILNGMRGQWVQAKRKGKKCSDLIEQLLECIEEAEHQEQLAEEMALEEVKTNPEEELEQQVQIKPEAERPVLKAGDEE
jgi:hypothetical protein